jgi:glyoxylase-like metal-dependent hydrolase (beta-lactamase superfamily II)
MQAQQAQIQAWFDKATSTISYVVYDSVGGHAAIIDPVLDYDPKAGRTHATSAKQIADFVREHDLTVDWILETHAHADHLSAAYQLKQQVGGKIAIGEHIRQVQKNFKALYNLDRNFLPDGRQFDHLFAEDEEFQIGALRAKAWYVPGHTPADMAYQIGDAVFVGDTMFMPDVGTARCDFPGGNAHTLYGSIQRLLALPADTRLFMCHDYPPASRAASWETTVAQQRQSNIHVHDGISEQEFVAMRTKRDATLEMPTLILPAVQVNIRAGDLPPAEDNGMRYLKIPLNGL